MEGWDGAKGEVFDEMRTRLGRVMVAELHSSCTHRADRRTERVVTLMSRSMRHHIAATGLFSRCVELRQNRKS